MGNLVLSNVMVFHHISSNRIKFNRILSNLVVSGHMPLHQVASNRVISGHIKSEVKILFLPAFSVKSRLIASHLMLSGQSRSEPNESIQIGSHHIASGHIACDLNLSHRVLSDGI